MPRRTYWVSALFGLVSLVVAFRTTTAFHALHSTYSFTLSAMICFAGVMAARTKANLPGRLLGGAFAIIAVLSLLRLPLYLGVSIMSDPQLTASVVGGLTAAKRLLASGVLLILSVLAVRRTRSIFRAWLVYSGAVLTALGLVWAYLGPLAIQSGSDADTLGLAYQCIITVASLGAVALSGVLGANLGSGVHVGLVVTSSQVLVANILFAFAGRNRLADFLGHYVMLLALLTLLARVVVPIAQEHERAVHAELQTTRDERDHLLALLVADEEERRAHLSREMHDSVGHPLTRLVAMLSSASRPGAPERDTELRALAAEALASIRDLARDLRPPLLDDIGLVAALRAYTESFERAYGITGRIQVIGSDRIRLSQAAETALYRVITEALTNTGKHSGASRYAIVIDLRGPVLSVLVEDDGHGFDVTAIARGLGLLVMSERMAQIGGTVDIESGADFGTTVRLRVPASGVGEARGSDDDE